jgi:2,4-dienoyl-CoA reductase-like NADH-dependent reductase (Old Yellow Enzyme family)
MSSVLFTPLRLRALEIPNRIMVSPMCQYSAVEGSATDWHLMHLGQFAVSGAGLVCVEMTNVEARGRISPGCMGLYSDGNEAALARVVEFCRGHGPARLAVQLGHAGRKASTRPPWEGREPLGPHEGGWEPIAPSAIPMSEGALVPRALSAAEIEALVERFAESARRALRIGFDTIELHGAHGYLLHQFLSPLSNHRDDEWGGTLERRLRFPLEVFEAVRAVWPQDRPLGMRVSATDWAEGGWDLDQTLVLARALRERGCDFMDVSSGGLVANQRITLGPGYQVPFAERVRREVGIPTIAVGLITEPRRAEEIVANQRADMVALARGMLYDPHWTWHAATELGADAWYPPQYQRCAPQRDPADVFAERRAGGGTAS